MHGLLRIFAESQVAAAAISSGCMEKGLEEAGELGKVTGEIQRAMSVQVVRSQALCLLERLAQLGPGAKAAAVRRKLTVRLAERRKREQEAFRMAHESRGSQRMGRA